MKESLKECEVCKEREKKDRQYEEGIEREKVEACLKALEREKIANGIQSSRKSEIQLKQQQKQQIEEKRVKEMEHQMIENMWHEVLIDDVTKKELRERQESDRRRQEAIQRRLEYDQQIATANIKRRELLRAQMEEENRRLEKMKMKMEQDHYEEINRKKEQQLTNKCNYVESRQIKELKKKNERDRERQLDNRTIRMALEDLRREREKKMAEMVSFKKEQDMLIHKRGVERQFAIAMEENSDAVAREWLRREQEKRDLRRVREDEDKMMEKMKAAQEYKSYLNDIKTKMASNKLDHSIKMEDVTRTALKELQNKYNEANEEIRRQIVYRNMLKEQIRDNQKYDEIEKINTENKQRPFTKKAEMFKDMMRYRIPESQARLSTNPIHPFRRSIEAQKEKVQLPSIRY